MKFDIPIGKETHLRIEYNHGWNNRKVYSGMKAVEQLEKIDKILNTKEADG